VSTIAWRQATGSNVICASGKWARAAVAISPADGEKAPMLYTLVLSRSAGDASRRRIAAIASGIVMNGMRVCSETKHA
jgi:hypothetical protein